MWQEDFLVEFEILDVSLRSFSDPNGIIGQQSWKKTQSGDHQWPCSCNPIQETAWLGIEYQYDEANDEGTDRENEKRPQLCLNTTKLVSLLFIAHHLIYGLAYLIRGIDREPVEKLFQWDTLRQGRHDLNSVDA